jgi:hypothetical protein
MSRIKLSLSLVVLLFCSNVSLADEYLKPFVLASVADGNVSEVQKQVEDKLTGAGFEIVGKVQPYDGVSIVVVTSDTLKKNAAQSDFGGYGAIQRIAITEIDGKIQVSYTNPTYMANAYRMEGDLSSVYAKLEEALGKENEFGSAKGLTAGDLRKYHYMFGMEYFDDYSDHLLAEHHNHARAVKTVETNLAQALGGVSKVYRVDIPGKDEVIFGVDLDHIADGDKYSSDDYIMSVIDFQETRSAAHLPIEILVSDNKVYALYYRFRIAMNFPDLSMMGANSFMKIMESPEAAKGVLGKVAGAKPESNGSEY